MSGTKKAPRPPGRLKRLLGPAFSPRGLLARAALITLACGLAHLAGLRDYTTILSGTSPSGNPSDVLSTGLGTLYVVLYLAFTVAAPVFAIAAGLFAGYLAFAARGKKPA